MINDEQIEIFKIKTKLDNLFKNIEQIRNWDFGYFKFKNKINSRSYDGDKEFYFEIKLEMSSDDYIAYNMMNKLLGEKLLKMQIKETLQFTKSITTGQNWQFDFNSYYFKIRLCDKINKKTISIGEIK